MNFRCVLLSIIIASSLPVTSHALTDRMAGIFTTTSGLFGAWAGKAIASESAYQNTASMNDKIISAVIGGACAAALGYLIFYSFTPAAYLKSAIEINQNIQRDPLISSEIPAGHDEQTNQGLKSAV